MRKMLALFCECCRKIIVDDICHQTLNDMCISCNIHHKVPEEKWKVKI